MQEYRELVETLVKLAEISRPDPENPSDSKMVTRQKRIQHGICDTMEDAAVAIDDLLNKLEKQDAKRQNEQPERGSSGDAVRERDRAMCDLCA